MIAPSVGSLITKITYQENWQPFHILITLCVSVIYFRFRSNAALMFLSTESWQCCQSSWCFIFTNMLVLCECVGRGIDFWHLKYSKSSHLELSNTGWVFHLNVVQKNRQCPCPSKHKAHNRKDRRKRHRTPFPLKDNSYENINRVKVLKSRL